MDFQITYLPEAIEFLKTLDEKAQDKIFYNIEKAEYWRTIYFNEKNK